MDLVQKRKQLRQRQVEKVKKFRQSNMSASAAVEKQKERDEMKKEIRKEIEKETQKESMNIQNSDGVTFARVMDIIGPANMRPVVSNGVWKGTEQIEEGKKKGLWDNIHAKRKRGEKPAKKGDKDYPKTLNVEGAAWTKKAGKNPEGGLNEKGRKSYERENPGSDLKAPQPEGGSRKKSFCARMGGMKKKLTSSKTANDPDSRINKALRKWKCNEAKVEAGRSDYGKASVRNKRRFGKEGEPAVFDASGERGKMIDQRRAEHKAKRGVKESYNWRSDDSMRINRINVDI